MEEEKEQSEHEEESESDFVIEPPKLVFEDLFPEQDEPLTMRYANLEEELKFKDDSVRPHTDFETLSDEANTDFDFKKFI